MSVGELPAEFWVFASRQSFMTVHNLMSTRCLVSASVAARAAGDTDPDWIPAIPNPHVSPWLSPYPTALLARYWTEAFGEAVRRELFPQKPSRLASLYAFGDEETCHLVAGIYKWDLAEVRRFKPGVVFNWARCNMSVVSLMNGAVDRTKSPVQAPELWDLYWSGSDERCVYEVPGPQPNERVRLDCGPTVWEYLIDGQLDLVE